MKHYKYITLFLSILMMITLPETSFAREYPPGEGEGAWVKYVYNVTVLDIFNQPVVNFPVEMTSGYWYYDHGENQTQYKFLSKIGHTNSNGFVRIEIWEDVTHCWPESYNFDRIDVTIGNEEYTIDVAQGHYSFLPEANATLTIYKDIDNNGVFDDYELLLAQKFCPKLILHSGDNGVRPVPVEIMDRNNDNILNYNDIVIDIFTLNEEKHGPYHPKEIKTLGSPTDVIWDTKYPYYLPHTEVFAWFDDNGDGLYGSLGDITATGMYNISPHFEFGAYGQTNGNIWYAEWHSKMQQYYNNSKYIDGTTYANLYYDNQIDRFVIQYWFYYPFNNAANRHEGDWEHINVIIDNQNPQISNIEGVVYYYHEDFIRKENPPLYNNTHPIVYVGGYTSIWVPFEGVVDGHGSHGSYPNSGNWELTKNLITENVDGNGLEITFNNFENIILLPDELIYNQPAPIYNLQGIDVTWTKFSSYWGSILSTPSAGSSTLPFLRGLLHITPNYQTVKFFGVWEWENDYYNAAPIGPLQNNRYKRTDFIPSQGQTSF